ncbi:MAG TPA: SCO family protein [Elusimicrobiota bacterium]|jgi:cytochrome oxidase Cu insertion factor (SCO1/SenC/PrrC family)|nr:SCO family protein [Elusimicrobiota bacterium]
MTRPLAAGLAAACALGAGLLLRGSRPAPPPVYGTVPDFALTDAAGRTVSRKDLLGKPWAASFIFTSCQGQCPMITASMAALHRKVPDLRLVSFSVDSADAPEDLARFAKAHGAGWTFLTGGPVVVQKLSMEGFKLAAQAGGGAKEPIIHSSKLVLVDGRGAIRGYFDSGEPGELERLRRAVLSQ